jgi:hypothetical protein
MMVGAMAGKVWPGLSSFGAYNNTYFSHDSSQNEFEEDPGYHTKALIAC